MQNQQIAIRIKLLCNEKNISIASLLEACSINRNFIYDLERKDKSPSADKLVKIADYFNCSVDYLLGRTDDPLLINSKKQEVYTY